jgi:hypothetical protein
MALGVDVDTRSLYINKRPTRVISCSPIYSVQGAADQLCSLSSLISGQGQRLDRELGPLSRCESEEQLDSLDPQQQQQLVYTTSSTPDKLLTFRSFDQNYRWRFCLLRRST